MNVSRGNRSRRTLRPKEPHLPPGYRLDYSDPEVLTLHSLRKEAIVARFSARGYVAEIIERVAWEDYGRATS